MGSDRADGLVTGISSHYWALGYRLLFYSFKDLFRKQLSKAEITCEIRRLKKIFKLYFLSLSLLFLHFLGSAMHNLQDLFPLTRGQTQAPYSGSAEP